MKKILVALMCLLIVGCTSTTNPPPSPVFKLRASTYQGIIRGSGFLVEHHREKFIITAGHCVVGSNLTWLLDQDKTLSPIVVKKYLTVDSNDLAILLVRNVPAQIRAFQLEPDVKLTKGTKVVAIGYQNGYTYSRQDCLVIGKASFVIGDKARFCIATNAKMVPGCSGGPLLYKDKVIGIHILADGKGRTFHLPIKELAETLEELTKD